MSLKDIAREAGTSISTVSRVLGNSEHSCNEEGLEEKIWEIARKQKYSPNNNAKNLRKGVINDNNNFTVDIFLTRFKSFNDDPFFSEVHRYLKEDILNQGCRMGEILNYIDIISLSESSVSKVPFKSTNEVVSIKQKQPLSTIIHKDNTGLIILGKCPEELIETLKKRYSYIVGIDRNPTNYEYDEVICNGLSAAEKAVEYLISLGHKDIAYIGDCTFETRYIGYYQALFNHKIPLDHSNIYPSNQTMEDGYRIMKNNILKRVTKPTAVFCANDITAIGVLKALKESRLKYMPSVVSIDNIRESEKTEPMLTTIDIPKKEMGRLALTLLLDKKSGRHNKNVRVELPCDLIKRSSCYYANN